VALASGAHKLKGDMAKRIRVVAAVIEKDGKYLITQRRESAMLPLLWEFPGGRVEEGEDDKVALARELKERLEAEVEVSEMVGERRHEYVGYTLELVLYKARLKRDWLFARKVRGFRWVASADFDGYEFPDADQRTMDLLLGLTK
jgi:8-oxo-dGTP diphosphatase